MATLALGAAVAGCGPSVSTGDGAGSSSSTGSPTATASTTAPATSSTTTSTTTTGTTSIGTTEGSTGFDTPDDGCAGFYGGFCFDIGEPVFEECQLDLQDCPEGEKCMPWANDGGWIWNATRCSPLDAKPDELGDPCVVEGSGVSGIDTCAAGLGCFGVDRTTNEGRCVELCSQQLQQCEDPGATCMFPAGGLMGACAKACDPLMRACDDGYGCYPFADQSFGCAPIGAGAAGAYGDLCNHQTDCQAGSLCVLAEHVPGCAGPQCCTRYCDPNAGNTCPDAASGQTCDSLSDDPLAGACL